MTLPLLTLKNLKKHFILKGGRGTVYAVDGVSFSIQAGETIGVVGESGCGKSTLGRVILQLTGATSGEIFFNGQDLQKLSKKELRNIRREMQIIFQDVYSSLDSRQKVSQIIEEPLIVHRIGNKEERQKKVSMLLEKVGLGAAAGSKYPHEFSGGQRQRIGIARAIALNPKLIVADESVSALDVSIQSQILNLMVELREELGLSYIFISHDLAVVEHICETIAVMYLGEIVEMANKEILFYEPKHPYTQALISAIPKPEPHRHRKRIVLQGDLPSPENPPKGCRFHPRCPDVMAICKTTTPQQKDLNTKKRPHLVSCHLYD